MRARIGDRLAGVVRLRIVSAQPERLLRRYAEQGGRCFDAERTEDGLLLSLNTADFFLLRGIARREHCRIRVIARRGLPFRVRPLLRRRLLLVCMTLSAALIWYLNGFVWTIGLNGCGGQMSERELLTLLRQQGLYTGAPRREIDSDELRSRLLLADERLSFVTVNLLGCHAEVSVRFREEQSAPTDEMPCDVVADKAGVITALRIRQGKAMAAVGDVVLPGDLLAGGRMSDQQGEEWLLHADAEADVRTWRTLEWQLTSEGQDHRRTGKRKKRRFLLIGARRIPLSLIEKKPFEWYDKQISRSALTLREDFRLTLALETETLYEYHPERTARTPEELRDTVRARMERQLAALLDGGEVLAGSFSVREGAPCRMLLEAECIERTGVSAPLADAP